MREITIETFIHAYEEMNNKKLSIRQRRIVYKYGIKNKGSLSELSIKELKFLKKIKEFQLEIMDLDGNDKLSILL